MGKISARSARRAARDGAGIAVEVASVAAPRAGAAMVRASLTAYSAISRTKRRLMKVS